VRVGERWTVPGSGLLDGHRGFEIFRERFAEFSGRLDRMIAEELVKQQEFVGAYYEADGDDLVPA